MMRKPTCNLRRLLSATLALFVSLLGCYDYTVLHPTTQVDAFYWELRADHRAVLLSMDAPYNTLQLTATPYNINGGAIAIDTLRDIPQIVWESTDTNAVKVSQTGVLTAEKVATRVNVYVTLSLGDVTRRDTIWVGVTQAAPSTLDSLVLYVPTGKNTVAAGGTLTLAARAKLVDGQPVTNVPVNYRVSNRWLADFKGSLGVLSGLVPDDSIYVYATTTVYGTTRRDSLFLYTGLPVRQWASGSAFILEALVSDDRKVIYVPRMVALPSAPGSSFRWWNNSIKAPSNAIGFPSDGMKVDIIFDHPEFAEAFLPLGVPPYNQSGNILQLPYDPADGSVFAIRKFTQPGEHWYTVQPLGARGKITIGVR